MKKLKIKILVLLNSLLFINCTNKKDEVHFMKTVSLDTKKANSVADSAYVQFAIDKNTVTKDSICLMMSSKTSFKFTTTEFYEKSLDGYGGISFFVSPKQGEDKEFNATQVFQEKDTLVIVEYDKSGKELLPYFMPIKEFYNLLK